MDPNDLRLILNGVVGLLGHAHEADSPVKPTDFYNEGWLTALTLSVAASGVDLLPFRIAPHTRWWTEALMRSPFNPRRRGDRRGEGQEVGAVTRSRLCGRCLGRCSIGWHEKAI